MLHRTVPRDRESHLYYVVRLSCNRCTDNVIT
jgi:hypothetical protein